MTGSGLVITIDGPAGSGKSSTALAVARKLRLTHLDSGALYRALTLALLRAGIPEEEWEELDREIWEELDLRLEPEDSAFHVLLDGVRVGPELRSPEVTAAAPRLAGIPEARRRLIDVQRSVAEEVGVVADGRDMGTVIFPDANLKIFLTASLRERARRRLLQEDRPADPDRIEEEAERIRLRDETDETREISPLRRPADSVDIDTTQLTFDEQVDRIVDAARRRASEGLTGRGRVG